MKVAFYLPVVTPWWFDNVIGHLIRKLAAVAEVHVLVPPLWSGTGIGPEQLAPFADVTGISWHILDDQGHPCLRTDPGEDPAMRERLLALVEAIGPDHVLCRSADVETPRRFPGRIHHVMEGAAPPFPSADNWILFADAPFDHGCLSPLEPAVREALLSGFRPAWSAMKAETDLDLAPLPLPEAADRPVIGLPLEYEHEENFFGRHRRFAAGVETALDASREIRGRAFLAVTNHPLNELHVDTRSLDSGIASMNGSARLLREPDATHRLARGCDGMILENSKAIWLCGFHGTPILRRTAFRTGGWFNAYDDLDAFADAVERGEAARPDPEGARLAFAFHIANDLVDPADPGLGGVDLIERLERRVDPARWEAGIERYGRFAPELFA
jgi:hypothetical protein